MQITPEMLGRVASVQKLFEVALEKGWVTPEERLKFFTAARSVGRRAEAGKIHNAGGAFTTIVKKKHWGYASQDDEERAREAIRRLDAGPAAYRPRTANLDEGAAAIETRRQEMIEAMKRKAVGVH